MNNIDSLSNSEKLYLLNVLLKEGVQYTKNSNGYFFNISTIDKKVRKDIADNLEYIIQNRDAINNIDKEREKYISTFKKQIATTFREKERKIEEDYIRDITLKPHKLSLNVLKRSREYIDPDILISERIEKSARLLKANPLYIKMKNTIVVRHDNTVKEEVEYETEDGLELEADSEVNYEFTEIEDFDDADADVDVEEAEDVIDEEEDVNTFITNTTCLKLKMDFYRSLLISHGYEFQNSSHDLLVIQEYI